MLNNEIQTLNDLLKNGTAVNFYNDKYNDFFIITDDEASYQHEETGIIFSFEEMENLFEYAESAGLEMMFY